MNKELFDTFCTLEAKGLKRESKAAVMEFIASSEGTDDIEHWVWTYLPKLEANYHARMRHELFEHLVFPVLKTGYQRGEYRALLWLGKLIQNLYSAKHLHAQIGFVSDEDLFRRCYAENPNDPDLRLAFRDCLVNGLNFDFHEWPEILVEDTAAAMDALQSDIDLAMALDDDEHCVMVISEFQLMLAMYRLRFGL